MPSRAPAINRNRVTNQRLSPDRAWVRILRLLLGAITVVAVLRNFYRSATGLSENTLAESLSQVLVAFLAVAVAVHVLGNLRVSLSRRSGD